MARRMTFRWGACFDACKGSFSATETTEILAECLLMIEFASLSVLNGKYFGPSRMTFVKFGCEFYLELGREGDEMEWVLCVASIPPGKRGRKRRSDAGDVDAPGGGEGAGAMPARTPRPPRKTAKLVLAGLYKNSPYAQQIATTLLYQTGRWIDAAVELLQKFRVPEQLRGAIEALRLAMMKRFGHLNEPIQPLGGGARLESRLVGAHVGMPLILGTFVAMAAPVDTARMIALAVIQESERLPL